MNFWYLRSAFICFTLAFISFKVLRNDYMSFILSFFVFLLLPDNGSIYYDKFMYPFFWMGYFIHKEISYIMKYKKALFATSLILLLILLDSYSKEATIYFTGMSFYNYEGGAFVYSGSWTRLLTIIHRYIIGAVGSLSAFILLHQLFTYRPKFESIRKWGQYTLGIYVIHVLIIYTLDKCEVFQHVHFLEAGFFSFNFIVTIIISAILIFISIVIIKFIEKNRISTWLFLGKKL
jgi:fucose 4-O-acetylase-like acetyltransferase